MKKSILKITVSDCAGIYTTIWTDADKLEQAKAAFMAWNEPNSYFKAERFEKGLFRWKYVETVDILGL